ncbi:MAG: alkaline phosphatase family protein [Planctomycetes bacterium]|nr:alkaline phosphatase family protein [Planctomycetota bacterium]MCB9869028.1 alkaline phosphatase family protein [Planctomycetota bacterium]
MRVLVLDVVGLRPRDLALAPNLRALAASGFAAPMRTVFPAVTCSVQATWLTGTLPREHGIVANGWYFRDLAQVWLWRQANQLVQGEKVYTTALRRDPATNCAKMFWWFNMYADVAYGVTPRPEYHADGLKKPGLYSTPAELHARLERQLGPFPLFQFWGPGADIRSTRWIVDATLRVISEHDPALVLAYLPHLDYDHQRFGPDDPRSRAAVADVDREAGRLIDVARAHGARILVMSEYGIEHADTPVFLNRVLHERGLLAVQETSHGQLLDCGASRAFAVADHQIAHVYVNAPDDVPQVRDLLRGIPGVGAVMDRDAQRAAGIDHERAGELVCEAEPGCWFAYHYWLDEARRPDFATTVDIHRKPGYDPTELFVDPGLRLPKLRVAHRLAKKLLGFRYLMDVIGTDPSIVRGSHGRRTTDPEIGPVFIDSSADAAADAVDATEVRDRILAALAAPPRLNAPR